MALDGTYTLYDLDSLVADGDGTITVEVGPALRSLRADDEQLAIGEQVALLNPTSGATESFALVAYSAAGIVLRDFDFAYLLAADGIARGTVVTTETSFAACFAAGTRLRTADGEAAVEALRIGDRVMTVLGNELAPIVWIGRLQVELAGRSHTDRPVRIGPDAIAPNLPCRPLLLSPDHALLIDGRLVPVRHLVNGASIAHDTDLSRVIYYHIELDRHDAVRAAGLACETYLDTGNRHQFDHANVRTLFAPDTGGGDPSRAQALRIWAEHGCAPLLLDGPELASLHRRLRERATTMGARLTEDADLRLTADGIPVKLTRLGTGAFQALLPNHAGRLVLHSRSGPAHEIASGLDDRRCLGVALASLTLDGVDIPLDHPALTSGFHRPEAACRWTDGAGVVQLPPSARRRLLRIAVHAGWRLYWDNPIRDHAGSRLARAPAA